MEKVQKLHFKLQPLLNKERIYENECIGRLRIIQDTFLNAECKLEDLKERKIICQSELKSKKQHNLASAELRKYEEYFQKLGSDINAADLKVQEITKKLRTVQGELAKIVKKRKALEKLRERWEEEYRSYLVTLSNKEMDDIAMTVYVKNIAVQVD